MDYRTPLSKARGHGAAKSGVSHWWLQRMTALALIPLTIWFCFGVARLPGLTFESFVQWVQGPINASLLLAVVVIGAYHGALGLQVVVEDYISNRALRTGLIVLFNGVAALTGLIGSVSVLIVALGG